MFLLCARFTALDQAAPLSCRRVAPEKWSRNSQGGSSERRSSSPSPGSGRRRDFDLGFFLIWIARNPLKSPESDERIQEIQARFLGLAWSGFGSAWRNLARGAPPAAPAGRPQMTPQRLEKIESAPGNGMARGSIDPKIWRRARSGGVTPFCATRRPSNASFQASGWSGRRRSAPWLRRREAPPFWRGR